MTFDEISTFIDKMKMLEASDTIVEEAVPETYVHPLVLAMRELQAEGIVETASTGQGGGSAGVGGGQMVGGPTTYEQEYDMFKRKGPRRLMSMTEALDSSYPVKRGLKPNLYYFITDNGLRYTIQFSNNKDNVDVEFWYTEPKTGRNREAVTGVGAANKVFGTVINVVKAFVERKKPGLLKFSADNDHPSRVNFYKALAAKADQALPGYKLARATTGDMYTTFVLKREDFAGSPGGVLDTVKHYGQKALDKMFEETTTLNQLYGDDKPDRHDTIWDYGTMIWDTPYEIGIVNARTLDMYLCDQYNVESIEDLFERMSEEQHEIVDQYINDPNLSNSIIVLDNGYIVDGNHRAIAAALVKKPIKYIDIGEEEDSNV